MQRKISLIITLFVLLGLRAVFADVTIKAGIEKNVITTDENFTYKLVIASTASNIVPKPDFPKFEGFKVISKAQSSTISFVKGSAKTVFVYVFILLPERKGKIKIEPSHIRIAQTDIFSESFEIEVKQGKKKIESSPTPKSSLPENLKSDKEQFTL